MEPPSSPSIDVLNRSGVPAELGPMVHAAQIALCEHAMAKGELCVVLTSDEEVRGLNLEHRGLDEATDVLTFPASFEASRVGHLGDLVIGAPFASRQAESRKVAFTSELAYLAIHGALHLAGFNDESEADKVEMQREMVRIAALAGLPPDPDWCSIGHEGEMEAAR